MIETVLGLLNPTVVLVFIASLLFTLYVIKLPRMLNMPPGPTPLPIIGNFFAISKNPGSDVHIFQSFARKYGKLCSLRIGLTYTLVISDYKLLVEAFVKKADVFSNRPIDLFYLMSYVNERLGAGIVTNHGNMWKQLRRTSLVAMRDFGVGKNSLEEKIMEEIKMFFDRLEANEGKPYNVKPLLNLATSNIICGVIFGSRFDYDDARFKKLLRVLDESLRVNPFFQPVNFFHFLKHIPYFRKNVETFSQTLMETMSYIKELIADNEDSFDPDNIRHFVDLFIKTKREQKEDAAFSDLNLRRVIVDLFTAGSDTTANTLSWLVLFMAKYPDIQARCQQEIDQVLGKSKPMSMADKDKLPFVEATVLEVLRLRPAAPVGVVHSTSQSTELGGYHIPKDTLVFSNIVQINRDPETFLEPELFNPEHFLDENGRIVNKEKMVAFSIGSRSCIGEILARMELTLFFTSILQFYDINPDPDHGTELTPDVTLLLRALPQNVVFVRRD